MFFFHHWFLLLFFAYFHCWFHLFISATSGLFITVSSGVFMSLLIFTIVFHKLYLTWMFFFARYFVFVLLYRECYEFERALFTLRRFLLYTSFPHLPQYRECYGFERAFLTLRCFHLTLLPNIWHSLLLSRLPREHAVLPWRQQGLPLRLVQQKLLFSRFYLCVKALGNTISASSRFWTHYLIAICIIMRMSYPPPNKSS